MRQKGGCIGRILIVALLLMALTGVVSAQAEGWITCDKSAYNWGDTITCTCQFSGVPADDYRQCKICGGVSCFTQGLKQNEITTTCDKTCYNDWQSGTWRGEAVFVSVLKSYSFTMSSSSATPTPTASPTVTPSSTATPSTTTPQATQTPPLSPTAQPAQTTPPAVSAIGDDFGTAKMLSGSGKYTGEITYEDKQDYYAVTTQPGQILEVAAIPGNDKLALILEIYNYKRSRLDSEVGSFGEIVDGMWTSGSEEANYIYYIAVKQVTGSGDYILEVLIDSQNDGNSSTDAGDTAERALLLPPLNATYLGFLQGDDKADYYMLNLTSLKDENFTHNKITVSISPKPKLGPYLRVYNKNKKELTSNFGAEGEGFTVSTTTSMDDDRVYIKIEKTFGYGSYAFSVNILPVKEESSIAVAAIATGGTAAGVAGAGYYLARRRRE